jgi:hypothetical protein
MVPKGNLIAKLEYAYPTDQELSVQNAVKALVLP